MDRQRLYILDTTLRDGAQSRGIDFTVADKHAIARELDAFGIDYIEAGWPGASRTDDDFFADPPVLERSRLVAFGMTRRRDHSAGNDPGLARTLGAGTQAVCLVGKSWDFHVRVALGAEEQENLDMIGSSLALARARGLESIFDAEHFFDGYRERPDYALACLRTALAAGARWVVLCDTNGGTLPFEIGAIIGELAAGGIPGERLGIHIHNDTGNAIAGTLEAVRAGVRHVQGTLNGIGERCGNADLCALLPTLVLKPPFCDLVDTGIPPGRLRDLTRLSRRLDELLDRTPDPARPYVGLNAFAHKGGLHGSGVRKDPRTYEHIAPGSVGNRRQVVVSDQAGRASILERLEATLPGITADDPALEKVIRAVRSQEALGYSYDGATASFELLALRALGRLPPYFRVDSFRAYAGSWSGADGPGADGPGQVISEAIVKVTVNGERLMSVAEGDGPVNALDIALRKDVGVYSAWLEDLVLVDYRVRILGGRGGGTGAVTRVLIESGDKGNNRWFTVGVDSNIINASFVALHDSLVYKLYRAGAPAASA